MMMMTISWTRKELFSGDVCVCATNYNNEQRTNEKKKRTRFVDLFYISSYPFTFFPFSLLAESNLDLCLLANYMFDRSDAFLYSFHSFQ